MFVLILPSLQLIPRFLFIYTYTDTHIFFILSSLVHDLLPREDFSHTFVARNFDLGFFSLPDLVDSFSSIFSPFSPILFSFAFLPFLLYARSSSSFILRMFSHFCDSLSLLFLFFLFFHFSRSFASSKEPRDESSSFLKFRARAPVDSRNILRVV